MTDYPNACNISYKRSRFSTRLPLDRRFTPSHFWLLQQGPGLWRVGLTKFATRMLGDLVEYGFEVKPGSAVSLGETIGWVEGFKATTDLFCVASGSFGQTNAQLEADATLLDSDPYGKGWLYTIEGEADPSAVDAQGYVALLDLAIDKIQGKNGRA
jgi:glycine cleavage system H protein